MPPLRRMACLPIVNRGFSIAVAAGSLQQRLRQRRRDTALTANMPSIQILGWRRSNSVSPSRNGCNQCATRETQTKLALSPKNMLAAAPAIARQNLVAGPASMWGHKRRQRSSEKVRAKGVCAHLLCCHECCTHRIEWPQLQRCQICVVLVPVCQVLPTGTTKTASCTNKLIFVPQSAHPSNATTLPMHRILPACALR